MLNTGNGLTPLELSALVVAIIPPWDGMENGFGEPFVRIFIVFFY
jgi:hypothetical protein